MKFYKRSDNTWQLSKITQQKRAKKKIFFFIFAIFIYYYFLQQLKIENKYVCNKPTLSCVTFLFFNWFTSGYFLSFIRDTTTFSKIKLLKLNKWENPHVWLIYYFKYLFIRYDYLRLNFSISYYCKIFPTNVRNLVFFPSNILISCYLRKRISDILSLLVELWLLNNRKFESHHCKIEYLEPDFITYTLFNL